MIHLNVISNTNEPNQQSQQSQIHSKKKENENQQVNVNYVKITNQLTNWECRDRLIKISKIFIENKFDFNCLSSFDFADFINNFVPQIAENQIDFK